MENPSLILHFDINDTITIYDSSEPGDMISNLNLRIARSFYGFVDEYNHWIFGTNPKEKEKEQEQEQVSYYTYLKHNYKKDYKKRASKCTNVFEPLESVAHYVSQMKAEAEEYFIFRSFIRVLHEFPHAHVVLRTFGGDSDLVIAELKKLGIQRTFRKAIMKHAGDEPRLHLEDSLLIVGYEAITKLFAMTLDIIVVKEDYNYWHRHSRNSAYGKWIYGMKDCVQWFFDDNECVHIVKADNTDDITFQKVNTVEAMLNKMYFCKFLFDSTNN